MGGHLKFRCIEGVAYRNTKNLTDKVNPVKGVSAGEIVNAVLVDGDWFKTDDGLWLPIFIDEDTIFEKFGETDTAQPGTNEADAKQQGVKYWCKVNLKGCEK